MRLCLKFYDSWRIHANDLVGSPVE